MAKVATGPLAQMFGSDPAAFITNAVKYAPSVFKTLVSRLADRANLKTWKAPGGTVTVNMNPSADDIPRLALAVAAWAIKKPGDFTDEALRIASNQPQGLDGNVEYARAIMKSPGANRVSHLDPATMATISSVAGLLVMLTPLIVGIAQVALPALLTFAGAALPAPEDVAGDSKPATPPPGDGGSAESKSSDGIPFIFGLGLLAKFAGVF